MVPVASLFGVSVHPMMVLSTNLFATQVSAKEEGTVLIRILEKAKREASEIVLIAPFWPCQIWFWSLSRSVLFFWPYEGT